MSLAETFELARAGHAGADSKIMPSVGLGTGLISDEDACDAVYNALCLGYRHIDTAAGYGNEVGVGKGIAKWIAEGKGTRSDVFVTTKLWPGKADWGMPETANTEMEAAEHVTSSLDKLGLEYVDLYLIHTPWAGKEARLSQWRACVAAQKAGKISAIGVSNFSIAQIKELTAAGLPLPSCNQVELHPWWPQQDLVAACREQGVPLIAYSSMIPLGTWRTLADGSMHENGKGKVAHQGDAAQRDADVKEIERIASSHRVTPAQVLLKWGLTKGYPVLPKTTKVDRMKSNFDLFSFALTSDDLAALDKMAPGTDGLSWPCGDPSKLG